ncbi:menaquinone-dependent protoporphyrinogen IX dehydrogenase [Pragia fontium]|uniref:Protoporphyrinogen IX dehydrogenase [quinone] n=1 Tax=Pragia fontium DSM 5563 = ATCC 49100 TaxID=1122977 RepID=A0AAJ4WD89_9GAMM|nr:menaquinone-dependent protoporphyrinogen IX dehydrogenase [Pragia fontium]SFD35773.1 menaquinone-dependent protoporphyrinogen oxidase [Pragia fontium DSM 5563 = ATCC 49100]VEJ57012.1 Protoporphyrinogen IX dehydrogenase [menaquinone] [Pragia fontium]
MKALLIYSSREGQTKAIVSYIANELREGIEVDLYNIDDMPEINFSDYNGVLIGASIRYGHFHKAFKTFVDKHYEILNQMPTAFVSVSLIARKAEKQSPQTNSYTRKYLLATRWKPTLCGVFAGALRYPRYTWIDRVMIQLIMKMTDGETDSSKEIEYTDWAQVKRFGAEFGRLISK